MFLSSLVNLKKKSLYKIHFNRQLSRVLGEQYLHIPKAWTSVVSPQQVVWTSLSGAPSVQQQSPEPPSPSWSPGWSGAWKGQIVSLWAVWLKPEGEENREQGQSSSKVPHYERAETFSCRRWNAGHTCRKASVWDWASRQQMSSLAWLILLMFHENSFTRALSLTLLLSSSWSTAFRPSRSSRTNKSWICRYSAETAFFLSRADS